MTTAEWLGVLIPKRQRAVTAGIFGVVAVFLAAGVFAGTAAASARSRARSESARLNELRSLKLGELESETKRLLDRIGSATVFQPTETRHSPMIRGVVAKAEGSGLAFRSVRSAVDEKGEGKSLLAEMSFSGRYRQAAQFVERIEATLPFARIERLTVALGSRGGTPTTTVYLRSAVSPDSDVPLKPQELARSTNRDPMQPPSSGPEPPPVASLPVLSGIVGDGSNLLAILVDPRSGETRMLRQGEAATFGSLPSEPEYRVGKIEAGAVELVVRGKRVTVELRKG